MRTRSVNFLFVFAALFALLINLTTPVQAATGDSPQGVPPFSGTIFIDPDIITAADPTTFQSVVYTGQGSRTMFDRRVDAFITVNAYLFNASFSDGLSAEIQVNPEFGSSAAAQVEAEKYGPIIGRLPAVLRKDMQFVWIHQGVQLFGGGNNAILIHTGQTALYEADGILEETLVHEAAHTSLDANHANAAGWLAAQTADGEFISTYAHDYPDREDIAESFLPYLAVHFRPDRIDQTLYNTIIQTIPNRISYFDSQSFNMAPIESPATFSDVPVYYWAWNYIERLYNSGITSGCNPGVYCPTSPVTRAQMAIFLEKGIHGSGFTPPNVAATFSDTVGHFAEDWIEALKNDGVTSGCGAGIYCPESAVTRAQMAIFLLKAKYGSSYTPPNVSPTFGDTAGHFAEDWIEQLAAEGITSGCGGGNYCPENSVTRDQMAVFLVKAFNLP